MQTRRQFIRLLLVGSGGSILAACSPSTPATPAATSAPKPNTAPTTAAATTRPAAAGAFDEQAVYAAAKQEGVVSFLFPLTPELQDVYNAAWPKRYPGIQLQMTNANSDVAVQRTILEIQSGKVTVDLTDPSRDKRIQDMDAAAQIGDVLDAIKAPPDRRFTSDRFAMYAPLGHGVVYNRNRVAEADVPKSWDDLLNPKFKGQMVVEERLKGFVFATDIPAYKGKYRGLVPEDQVADFLSKLKDQNPVIIQGNSPVAAGIASGEYALSPDLNFGSFGQIYWAQKAPVDLAPVSPIATEPWLMFIPKLAPHPSTARLLLHWLLSPEGIKVRAGAFPGYEMGPDSGDPIADVIKAKGAKVVPAGIELFDEYTRLERKYRQALGLPVS